MNKNQDNSDWMDDVVSAVLTSGGGEQELRKILERLGAERMWWQNVSLKAMTPDQVGLLVEQCERFREQLWQDK